MMSSPPRSPSTKAVTTRSRVSFWISSLTLVPSTATVFLIPYFRRLSTSLLPSTMTMASEVSTLGPAGLPYLPKLTISSICTA